MKIFMIEWSQAYHLRIAQRLAEAGIEVLYWTGGGRVGRREGISHERVRAFHPRAITQTSLDAMRAKPAAALGPGPLPAPGRKTLKELFEAESNALTMMDRFAYPEISVSARKQLFYRMVQHWDTALDRLKPDCVVNPRIPHMVYDYVLYELCRLRSIRHLGFDYTRVAGRMLVVDDIFRTGHAGIQRRYAELRDTEVTLESLPEDVRRYAAEQLDRSRDVTPFYMTRYLTGEGETLVSPWKRFWHYVRERGISFAVRYEALELLSPPPILSYREVGRLRFRSMRRAWERRKRRLRAEYDALARPPVPDQPYVYVPLHYQPECTTSPQGGIFVNQQWMVEILAQSLPEGWRLYVKEHPRQLYRGGTHAHQSRAAGYYEALAALPGVQLMPRDHPGLGLVTSARAVASVGGTAGVEALFRGIPSLVFGYPYYLDMPGVHRVGDVEECRALLRRVEAGELAVREGDILRYLAALGDCTIHGYVETLLEGPSGIPRERAADLMAESIREQLRADGTVEQVHG